MKSREMIARDQVAGLDNARIFPIDHSDKFRSHFASVLVYCYLFITYCFVRLPSTNPDRRTATRLMCPTTRHKVRVRHSEGSDILKAVIHGRCHNQTTDPNPNPNRIHNRKLSLLEIAENGGPFGTAG